jgi:hypothetical protein
MDPNAVLRYCDEIDSLTQLIRGEVTAAPPIPPETEFTTVPAGADLQAALSQGGALELESGATFAAVGGFRIDTPGTMLRGAGGNVVSGDGGAALQVLVEMRQASIETLTPQMTRSDIGIQIGRNDTGQTTLAQAPDGVRIRGVIVPSLRGKRAIEVDAANVEILDCDIRDVYHEAALDSQAVWIGNAPGPVHIEGGHFEGASEDIMVGGDKMKIPNCRPTGITIRQATLTKPLAWKDAGIPKVKNLFELKDGNDVLIEDCDLSNSWKSAQDGYCFMFTPSQGGSVRNVVVRNCRVSNVGGIVNITGTDASNLNPDRTQVSIFGGDYRTNKVAMGGTGRFCLITRGPEFFITDGATIAHEGSAFIEYGDSASMDLLQITNCHWNYGSYGIRIGGYNHGDNSQGIIRTVTIEGNTITGAHSQFRDRYPNNTYIEAMDRDREHHVDKRAKEYAREFLQELDRVRRWESEYKL